MTKKKTISITLIILVGRQISPICEGIGRLSQFPKSDLRKGNNCKWKICKPFRETNLG